jgi:hypothetical protein
MMLAVTSPPLRTPRHQLMFAQPCRWMINRHGAGSGARGNPSSSGPKIFLKERKHLVASS